MTNVCAIFKRKPSALMPLDGLRAIAVLWVFGLHTLVLNSSTSYYLPCLFTDEPEYKGKMFWLKPVVYGDLGVDIFFVLSGFLIAFVLFKDIKKYGSIDYWNFIRSRFFRIWPAMAAYCLNNLISMLTSPVPEGQPPRTAGDIVSAVVPPLFFVNNLYGPEQHLWSIAVEFQFYLISPLLVYQLAKSDKPWLWPSILVVVSVFYNYLVSWLVNKPIVTDSAAYLPPDNMQRWWFNVYEQTIPRMSPYLFGMYAAYVHYKDDGSFHH